MLDTFTLDTFRRYVGEDFQIAARPDGTSTLRLASAQDLSEKSGADPGPGRRTPFSLLFHGPVENYLRQATYLIRHDAIGEFPLFLVPLGPEEGRMRYEAIFT
jgi:hypothetical protein